MRVVYWQVHIIPLDPKIRIVYEISIELSPQNRVTFLFIHILDNDQEIIFQNHRLSLRNSQTQRLSFNELILEDLLVNYPLSRSNLEQYFEFNGM